MKKYLLLIILSLLYTQELDLSLDWTMADDVFYSQQLDSIIENQISNLSSIKGIIVIHNGKIVSEEYFNDSSVDDIFHIWSVTKSFTSTLIGQAIDMGYITHPSVTLDSIFFENDYTNQVTLDNLLSMTSGWPENWYYLYTNNIINVLLSTPLETNPGDIFFYNNSACHINSYVLLETTGLNPKEFAMEYLFPYLGFGNPNWGTDYDGVNNGSYDLYLNLRKMVKLGQLYLQDGVSGDNQIISSSWINDATSFKVNTIPDFWFPWDLLPGYGYLWWLPERGYLAFGYGGQFIAVVPELDLVIGTHSTDNEGFNVYYIEDLLGVIYDDIVPLFDLPISIIDHYAGWNLVGLPLEVEDALYSTLFPESIGGTLYSFNGAYDLATYLINGEGYWLRFNEAGSTTISGTPFNELTISLNEGWNLISGITNSFNISSIEDPDGIIIAGTVYGFASGGYSNEEIIEPGKGYWVRANSSGSIIFISD